MIFQIQAKDTVVRINQYDAVSCVQNLNWDAALNTQYLEQLGSVAYDAAPIMPEVTGSFEVRSTGGTSSLLSRMIYGFDQATGEFTGPLGTANTGVIRETDLELAVFDLIDAQQANEVFDRSALIPRAFLSQFTLSARTDGPASETYNFEADVREVYRKPLHDLTSVPVTRDSTGTPATTVVFPATYKVEGTTVDATAEWKLLAIDVDGNRIVPADVDVVDESGTGLGPWTATLTAAAQAAGKTFPLGARTHAFIYRKTPGAFPTISYPTTARFVKADQIDIWLVDPTATFTVAGTTDTVEALLAAGKDLNLIPFTDADLWLRLQSLDISVNLNREALREIRQNERGNSIFYRAMKFPLQIQVSASALVTDLNDWAKIQHKNAYGSATPDVLNLADFEEQKWVIVRRDYKKGTTLQTIALLDARVDSTSNQTAVNGRTEQPWQFTASLLALQGTNA